MGNREGGRRGRTRRKEGKTSPASEGVASLETQRILEKIRPGTLGRSTKKEEGAEERLNKGSN